jgi:hypothetical protein
LRPPTIWMRTDAMSANEVDKDWIIILVIIVVALVSAAYGIVLAYLI